MSDNCLPILLDMAEVYRYTVGRIAAQYYELLHQCYPLPRDENLRSGEIAEIVQSIQQEGKPGAGKLALAAASLTASMKNDVSVQELAESLKQELAQYKGSEKENPCREKKKSQER